MKVQLNASKDALIINGPSAPASIPSIARSVNTQFESLNTSVPLVVAAACVPAAANRISNSSSLVNIDCSSSPFNPHAADRLPVADFSPRVLAVAYDEPSSVYFPVAAARVKSPLTYPTNAPVVAPEVRMDAVTPVKLCRAIEPNQPKGGY